jgi:chromosome segregation ATPase
MASLLKRKNDPIAEAERDIATLQGRRATLANRLQSADTELRAATDERRNLLVGGDIEDGAALTAVEQKIAAAERSRDGLVEALILIDERLGAGGVRLSELRDAAEREQIAAAARSEADALAAARDAFTEAASKLVTILARAAPGLRFNEHLDEEDGPLVCPSRQTS